MAKRRVGLMAIASWAFAALITGLVVWRAVAVLDDGTRTDVLSGAQVSGLLASASSTPGTTTASGPGVTIPPASTEPATPAAVVPGSTTTAGATTGSASPKATVTSPATKTPAPVPTPVARTWNVAGGVVSVACTSQTISLLSASPADGWRVKIENRGPDRIKLEFTSGDRETKVGGTCVAGVPQQSTTDND